MRTLWERFEARDWGSARELLSDDFSASWPHTGERFATPDAFIRVNEQYPEGWTIHVLRVVAEGDTAVSEVRVDHTRLGTSLASSWWTARDGRLASVVEYWVDEGAQPIPLDRRRKT